MSGMEQVPAADFGQAVWLSNDPPTSLDSTAGFRESRSKDRGDEKLREARRLLSASEKRFQLLVESVTDYAIFMVDPEGRVAELEHWRGTSQGVQSRGGSGTRLFNVLLPRGG